ncbi:MAG: methylenetetrahydrofolate reductase [Clostridia bacterium]|nr:methylenetetrahydrofolate reductase [NAD(P)H] [Clostridia bacterium]
MKISEILKNDKLTISFEVFPPKTESAFDSIKAATEEIASLKPAFMSVTYGAGGGTSRYTVEIAKNIEQSYGVPTLAHLTCVSSTKETVRERILDMKAAGISNVMALRGDIPADMLYDDRTRWDYNHAIELIRELRESDGDFCIGGACYPEVHPESENADEDIKHLLEKVNAGCDFLTTQMFFDNELFYAFLNKARGVGINIPIIPGIMPITRANQIERAIKLSGSYMPRRFISLVDKFGSDPSAMTQAGIAYATDQIIDLFANGITNVHVYSMNNPRVAAAILNNLSDILGK